MSSAERAARVLVLGGGGFIGSAVMRALKDAGMAPVAAVRKRKAGQTGPACLCDATDLDSVTRLAMDADYAVNAVLGSAETMQRATAALCEAARRSGLRRLVHISSMSVYGNATGLVSEDAPLGARDRYGTAKIACERLVERHAAQGGETVILRPGIVHGPGGEQWVARIGRLLRSGRLGDLGEAGDGYCNLAYVGDVAAAVVAALRVKQATGCAINVAGNTASKRGTAGLRWNEYFVRLGCAIGAVPVRRIGSARLSFEARVMAPALRITRPLGVFPDPISPSLLDLWRRQMMLGCGRLEALLGVRCLPDEAGIAASAAWLLDQWDLEGEARAKPRSRTPVLESHARP